MKDLIKALTILAKYMDDNVRNPTYCEHDELMVMVMPEDVSQEDVEQLDKLGFFPSEEDECFKSFRFGSC